MAFLQILRRLASSTSLTDSPSAEIAISQRLESSSEVDQSGVPSAAELVEYTFLSSAAMYNVDPSGLKTIAVASSSSEESKSGKLVLDLHCIPTAKRVRLRVKILNFVVGRPLARRLVYVPRWGMSI